MLLSDLLRGASDGPECAAIFFTRLAPIHTVMNVVPLTPCPAAAYKKNAPGEIPNCCVTHRIDDKALHRSPMPQRSKPHGLRGMIAAYRRRRLSHIDLSPGPRLQAEICGAASILHERWDETEATRIVDAHESMQGALLPILHAIQASFGYIPQQATAFLARKLNLSRAEVHGVISFYHDFRRAPAGKLVVKICRAEACQAMGGAGAAEALLKHLGISWSETTADQMVTVEPVYCLGLCAVAPAALINGEPTARFDGKRLIDKVEAAR